MHLPSLHTGPRLAAAVVLAAGTLAPGCGDAREAPGGRRAAADPPGSGSSTAEATPPQALDLVDEARERGLAYANRSGGPEKRTILEAGGAGVAVLDLGSDGDLDVVFAQGLPSLAALRSGPGADLEVFENDGTGNFRRLEGPGLSGWWTGLAAGDVDGDGDADLVAGGFGALWVLLQDDAGRLRPRADLMPAAEDAPDARIVIGAERPAGRPPLWVTSLALFDADRDGVLDLYVGQYLDLDPVEPAVESLGEGALAIPCRWKGYPVYCGPRGLPPQADRMLRGRGDGTFQDRTAEWLPEHLPGYTLAVAPFDADGDGDTDVAVANDSSANLLLLNDGDGRLRDHGYGAGFALSPDGAPEAGMGIAIGDVDRDGHMDLVVTNFSDEPTSLYFAAATGFANETFRYGLSRATRRLLSWSVHLADFDGDGWLELFTANGHVYPQADRPYTGTSYGQPDTLWHLGPTPRAEEITSESPDSLLVRPVGTRGTALGDLDGDGAPDIVAAHIDAPASLGHNTARGAARLLVRCLGPAQGAERTGAADAHRTPADGMGTRVIVVAGEGDARFGLLGEVQTAQGYQSASSPWLHFGLGEQERYEELRILWPSGRVETLPAGPTRRRLWIREGEGIVESEQLP